MAKQLYGYTPKYSSSSPSAALQRYLESDSTSHSHLLQHLQPWPPGVELPSSAAAATSLNIKRPNEVLYHQNILDAHNTIGQTEAWFSTSSLVKRPKLESASTLPVYPQRPGEKDCAHYMLTRTCKYGDSCKFDHPIWVPEGGIPDWKEVLLPATDESLPERPGEPDCPYFVKTQRCKFGLKCKFNHPKDKLATSGASELDVPFLPERPSEPPCAFYVKTGKCKFGATCKFNHPKDIQIPSSGQENTKTELIEILAKIGAATADVKPAEYHNTKGLPVRQDEVDCPFYMKTGSCKYGSSCRYNHPERNAFNPPAAAVAQPLVASASNLNIGVTPLASLYQTMYQTIDPRLSQPTLSALEVAPAVYPQRPGQAECDYYMRTGECKFGDRCRFHHPFDRSVLTSQQALKLTLAGLPRREGSVHCPYYMKTGTCKYGATCKFDHPPPGEVVAMAATSMTIGEE